MAQSEDDVEGRLVREAERAHGRFKTEAVKFRKIIDDVPSGLPYPDSIVRLFEAAKEHNEALQAYRVATKRLHEYRTHRSLPESSDEDSGTPA